MVKVSERKATKNGKRFSNVPFGNEDDHFDEKLSINVLFVGVASQDNRCAPMASGWMLYEQREQVG